MSRLERPESGSSNPAKRFIEWKSKESCFSYYDKAIADELAQEGADAETIKEKANVKMKLPLKVLFLEHYHCVKGWHDASGSNIYSNEVFQTGTEPMTVKASKGGEIATGLYKDIKIKVNQAGGDYHRSVYVMLEDGTLANIVFKGACVGGLKKEKAVDKTDHVGYSEFINNNSNKLDYHWIVMGKAHKGKSGSVTFSIPDFTVGERISEEVDAMAIEAALELQVYVNDRTNNSDQDTDERANSEVNKYEAASANVNLDEVDI